MCSPVLVTEEESDFVWEIMQTRDSLPSSENIYIPGSGITRVFLLTCQVAALWQEKCWLDLAVPKRKSNSKYVKLKLSTLYETLLLKDIDFWAKKWAKPCNIKHSKARVNAHYFNKYWYQIYHFHKL